MALPLRQQAVLPENPKVTVCCPTFNHGAFIVDALEGFLNQRVDFPVEILLHDDASTDGTAAIVARYAKAYPGVFRATLQRENQYSKGVNVLGELRRGARGTYLAYCEGDDYWADEQKLSRQARYLDEHPDIVMVGHDVLPIDADGTPLEDRRFLGGLRRAWAAPRSMTATQLKALRYVVPTCAKMFRNVALPRPEGAEATRFGDAVKQAMLGSFGGYHHLPGVGPVYYRVHGGGEWSSRSKAAQYRASLVLYGILKAHFHRQGDRPVVRALAWKAFKMQLKLALLFLQGQR